MLTIVQAETDEHIRHVQGLLTEYFEFLRTDVDNYLTDLNDVTPLAGYQDEIADLPGKFAPPDGRLLLAYFDGEPAGCVAFYKFSDGVCELKRLWARPQFRGKQIGRALVETLIGEARNVGYTAIILSTVDMLTAAKSLYTSLGFELTTPYFDGPAEMMAREVFMKLDLAPQ